MCGAITNLFQIKKRKEKIKGKKIEEMTEKEILRQQLELLAKVSKDTADEILPRLSENMCQIYILLK